MSQSGTYKQYTRTQRNIVLEDTFNKGMCTDDNPLDDGTHKHLVNFQILDEGKQLVPRRGKIPDTTFNEATSACALYMPPTETATTGIFNIKYDVFADTPPSVDDELIGTIRKFIIACPNELYYQRNNEPGTYANDNNIMPDGKQLSSYYMSKNSAPLFLASTEKIYGLQPMNNKAEDFFCKIIDGPYIDTTNEYGEVRDAKIQVLSEIDKFKPMPRLVGSALGNNLYTIGTDKTTRNLVRVVPCPVVTNDEVTPQYYIEDVVPKEIDPVYAVNYGYNMLSPTPYTFTNQAKATWQLNGLLPYSDEATSKLILNYSSGERVYFKAYFDYKVSDSVTATVSIRPQSTDVWTTILTTTVTSTATTCDDLTFSTIIPDENFFIRVEFVDGNDTVVSSADYPFSGGNEDTDNYGTTKGLESVVYDLTSAIGMLTWKQRLVLWGVDKAPNMLFTSDINNPTYFAYPDGCELYDDNILHVCIFMDALMIFTASNIYKTTLDDSGKFKTEVVVTDINMTYEDTYSIVPVKNMLFYKSDNYYYMLVPSSKALTFGEFNVAPVSNPINYMLDHFDTELKQVLIDMYASEWGYPELEDITLIPNTYQVYLANNDVCLDFRFKVNVLGKFDNLKISYVLKYNTVLRTWSADLYYTPFSCIQMYIKNIAGVPRYITYSHNTIGDVGITFVVNSGTLYAINNDGTLIRVTDESLIVDTDKLSIYNEHTIRVSANTQTYKIIPKILMEAIDDTVDTYAMSDNLPNKQFIDTGYRNLQITNKKRMREIQIKINDKLAVPLEFRTGFIMDNRRRINVGSYLLTPTEDRMLRIVPTSDILKVHGTTGQAVLQDNDIDDINENVFTLGHADLSLHDVATVRWKVSGKGYLPRMSILSANKKSYEITGISWVARTMNAR